MGKTQRLRGCAGTGPPRGEQDGACRLPVLPQKALLSVIHNWCNSREAPRGAGMNAAIKGQGHGGRMGPQGAKGKVHAAACMSCFHWNKANGTTFKAPKQKKKNTSRSFSQRCIWSQTKARFQVRNGILGQPNPGDQTRTIRRHKTRIKNR